MFAGNPARMSTRLAASDELYAYQNTLEEYGCRLPGSEYFTFFTVANTTPVGTLLVNQPLNPLMFPDTRLASIAKNYLEFRFTRARIVHVPTVSTAVDGALVMNYFSNPEFELGPSPAKTMFATRGYKSPIRTRGSVDAILDKEWRLIDLNSSELLKTCQGKFSVALDTATTVSGTLSFQMIIEYVVEFRGISKQSVSFGTPVTGVQTTMTPDAGGSAILTLTVGVTPAPSTTTPYLMVPALNLASKQGPAATGLFAMFVGATQFAAFASLEDIANNTPIQTGNTPAFISPFITYTPVMAVN
jgi:hypothetical protein